MHGQRGLKVGVYTSVFDHWAIGVSITSLNVQVHFIITCFTEVLKRPETYFLL